MGLIEVEVPKALNYLSHTDSGSTFMARKFQPMFGLRIKIEELEGSILITGTK
jgi:hypothetical protein